MEITLPTINHDAPDHDQAYCATCDNRAPALDGDYWELQSIEVRAPEDIVKSDDELWCSKCESLICDIEVGDTLDTLARTAMAHTCSEARAS